jgi:hypothetical protein
LHVIECGLELDETYLPLLHEVRKLGEELSPRTVVLWIFSVERHDIIVALLHILKEDLQLLRLSSRLLHTPLYDNRNLVFWVKLGGVGQVTSVER